VKNGNKRSFKLVWCIVFMVKNNISVGLGSRILAFLIDIFIGTTLIGIGGFILTAIVGIFSLTFGLFVSVITVFMIMTYVLIKDGFGNGQSLGKKLLGIRVINRKTGQKCSFTDSAKRNILFMFFGVLWCGIEIGYMAVKRTHVRIGDNMASTEVVKA
jgi:uncharacterized RDD family membrane protein YckC